MTNELWAQIQFLKDAKDSLEKQKWELISQKMLELGCKKKIPAATCEKKWKEMNPGPLSSNASTGAASPLDMKRELSQGEEE
jgi:hypothetical protein